jgi:environmental stress-induced protein Ves
MVTGMGSLLQLEDFKIMRWKNGRGTSAQIAIEPPLAVAATDPFHWRLSTALVLGSHEFSVYSGYERVIMVVRGNGLVLNEHTLPPFIPYHFSGSEKVSADLLMGPVEDIGVIYDPKVCKAQMRNLLNTEQSIQQLDPSTTTFLYCTERSIQCGDQLIKEGSALRIDGEFEQNLLWNDSARGILIEVLKNK